MFKDCRWKVIKAIKVWRNIYAFYFTFISTYLMGFPLFLRKIGLDPITSQLLEDKNLPTMFPNSQNPLRSLIHRNCKCLQQMAQGIFIHWMYCETNTHEKQQRNKNGSAQDVKGSLVLPSSHSLNQLSWLLSVGSPSILIIFAIYMFMLFVCIYSLIPRTLLWNNAIIVLIRKRMKHWRIRV